MMTFSNLILVRENSMSNWFLYQVMNLLQIYKNISQLSDLFSFSLENKRYDIIYLYSLLYTTSREILF